MGLDIFGGIKEEVRAEAEKGARKALTLPIAIAIGLSLYTLDQLHKKKRRRRR